MSDPAIITKLVTGLSYNEVLFGEAIVEIGQHPVDIMIIKKNGVSVLGIDGNIRILDLFEESFFGEWEVIFDKPSERSYIAINHNNDYE